LTERRDNHHDVVIIGSGPAGLTAAVYAARANLAPLVIEGEPSSSSDQPGGQLMLTTDVENYPGFPDGILGPELMVRFRDQAARFGATLLTAKATKVDFSADTKHVWVGDEEHTADAVIVSTGAQSLMLGLEAESRLLGHGLSTCATCDGFFFRGDEIAVVGGGDSALEEALFLTKFATKVTVVHRRGELRASKIMQERALAHERIAFRWHSAVQEVVGTRTGGVTGARLVDTRTSEESLLPVQGVFVAIGHQPNTQIFQNQLAMNSVGYIEVREPTSYTSVEGVFAAGDVMDPHYRQAVTAAGTGCRAAIDAERWLEAQESALGKGPAVHATVAAAAGAEGAPG
jgi:thioredoxin reductase (NADPH)